jgi:hypothetical protein
MVLSSDQNRHSIDLPFLKYFTEVLLILFSVFKEMIRVYLGFPSPKQVNVSTWQMAGVQVHPLNLLRQFLKTQTSP